MLTHSDVLQLSEEWLNFVIMKRLWIIWFIILSLGLGACKSHKATVVRATGKPSTSASRPAAPKAPSVPKDAAKKSDYANDKRIVSELVKHARSWIGTPYRYGACEKNKGTDCSGFTMTLFKDVTGLKLPRNSAAQSEYCFSVPKESLQAGDLVFFTSSTRGGNITHVGLYVGGGKMIHASTSRGVIESGLDEKYYASHYHSSGRVHGITYAATGKKPDKKGDKKEILLATEGVKGAEPSTPVTAPAKASEKPKSAEKSPAKPSKPSPKTPTPVKETPPAVVKPDPAPVETATPAPVQTATPAAARDSIAPEPVRADTVAVIKTVPVDTIAVKSAPVDTAKAESIKAEVVKAMRFGK